MTRLIRGRHYQLCQLGAAAMRPLATSLLQQLVTNINN